MRIVFCDAEFEKNLQLIDTINFEYLKSRPGIVCKIIVKTENQADLARFVEKCSRDNRKDVKIEVLDDENRVVKPAMINAFVSFATFNTKEKTFFVEFEGRAVL